MAFGEYPEEYNLKAHGSYESARYYGKTDISSRSAWFDCQHKNPKSATGTVSRAFWRWHHKYWPPKRIGIALFFQVIVGRMIFFYAINYVKMKHPKNYKYH